MALTGHFMRKLIEANGHLILEGNESPAELREALINLAYSHRYTDCQRPELGTSIDALIPDTRVLSTKSSGRPRRVVNVDLSAESE